MHHRGPPHVPRQTLCPGTLACARAMTSNSPACMWCQALEQPNQALEQPNQATCSSGSSSAPAPGSRAPATRAATRGSCAAGAPAAGAAAGRRPCAHTASPACSGNTGPCPGFAACRHPSFIYSFQAAQKGLATSPQHSIQGMLSLQPASMHCAEKRAALRNGRGVVRTCARPRRRPRRCQSAARPSRPGTPGRLQGPAAPPGPSAQAAAQVTDP